MATVIRFDGKFYAEAFFKALLEIFNRHISFSTMLTEVHGQPYIKTQVPIHLNKNIVDLSKTPPDKIEALVHEMLTNQVNIPFNLSEWPLFRYQLLYFNEELHYFIFCVHHILLDGISYSILLKEISVLYSSFANGNPISLAPIQHDYNDFIKWQREHLTQHEKERILLYWKNKLAGLTPLALPTDQQNENKIPITKVQSYHFPQSLCQQLEQFCKEKNKSSFTVLFAAFYALLYRYSGQPDFCVGVPTHGRGHDQYQDVIGFFVNILPIRLNIQQNTSFEELLDIVKQNTREALAHQLVPTTELISELNLSRTLNRDPLYQTMFELDNAAVQDIYFDAANMTLIETASDKAPYDIVLEVHHYDGKVHFFWNYDSNLFKSSTIKRMIDHWMIFLSNALENPTNKISLVPLMSNEEKKLILLDWNNTQTQFPEHISINQWVETQVAKTPNNIALVDQQQKLTYREMNERANQLANYLQTLPVNAEAIIGICLDRSVDCIVAMLAILKSGGAYLPIDSETPHERLIYMLEDAGAIALITTSKHAKMLSGYHGKIFIQDEFAKTLSTFPKTNLKTNSRSNDLAYVIYTSGSTGKPKGTLLEHRGLCNLSHWYHTHLTVSDRDRASQFSSVAFDAAGCEIWPFLTVGASVWIVDTVKRYSPFDLKEWLMENKITVADIPTMIGEYLLTMEWTKKSALRILKLGGEKLGGYPQGKYPFEIWNTYGPTEATIECIACHLDDNIKELSPTSPPIGKPISNCVAYILDEYQQPAPIGVEGELYLSGVGLARGYLNQPSLTAANFIPNPFHADLYPNMYKTGDICRFLEDGTIEFIKRRDEQIKIRGYRIELNEIASSLQKHPDIQQAIVTVDETAQNGKQLLAYWIPKDKNKIPSNQELHTYLQTLLPRYMIPSDFIRCENFPITATGKLDKKALPPSNKLAETYHEALEQTQIELKLAKIWHEILHHQNIGLEDNFFTLGGHSLSMLQLQAKINHEFKTNIKAETLLQFQTLREQSAYLSQSESTHTQRVSIIKLNKNLGNEKLFCIHPMGGNVVCYKKLADLLNDKFTVYGIQATEIDSLKTVEAMAQYYLTQVREIQPKGPYQFLGWSTGGLIAFEMAKQVIEQQDAVQMIALLDTYDPAVVTPVLEIDADGFFDILIDILLNNTAGLTFKLSLIKRLGLSIRYLAPILPLLGIKSGKINLKNVKYYIELMRQDMASHQPRQFPLEDWINVLRSNQFISDEIENNEIYRIYETIRNNAIATEQYRPGYYPGTILDFEIQKPLFQNTWASHCDRLTRIIIPSHHYDVMNHIPSLMTITNSLRGLHESK